MFKLETLVDVVALIAASKRERAIAVAGCIRATGIPFRPANSWPACIPLAQAFASWGIVKGDRIALLAENRWEWPVVDFATLVLGAADVPIYPTLTAEQIAAPADRLRRPHRCGLDRGTIRQDCFHPQPDPAGAYRRHGRHHRTAKRTPLSSLLKDSDAPQPA